MTEQAERDHVYLVDGSAYIFRAFHALQMMTRPDGTPVNAVYGFVRMLTKLVDDTDADYLAVIFDTARRTFRNDIYPEYKAHRPPPPPELVPQFDLIREATRAYSLPCIEMAGFEADDLIATYALMARERGFGVTIVSSDKDLMQLVGPEVRMMDPMRDRLVGPDEVVEKFGVGPDRVIDVQALAGDSSDNVPGVPGIGIKTAAQLIDEYGDLDSLLERAGEIKQNRRRENLIEFAEQARVSRRLVTLVTDVPVEASLDDFRRRPADPAVLMPFLEEQGFKSILARERARLPADEAPAGPGDPPADAEAAYELVRDEAALEAWIARIADAGLVAVDTETTSLQVADAELVGVSLCVAPGHACYIPLGHVVAGQGARPGPPDAPELDFDGAGDPAPEPAPGQIPRDAALALLRTVLEDPGILKIGHNIKYDMHVLARCGIDMAPVDDTMLLSYVLEAGKQRGHGLDELSSGHLGHDNIKYGDVAGTGKKQIGFAEVAIDKALDYAAEDADMTNRLHRLLRPRIAAERMAGVYETLERPLVPILFEMERAGIAVDRAILDELSVDFAGRAAAIASEIHGLAGREFNIGSPRQLGEILFGELGLEGGRKTKGGDFATDARVLEDLAAQGHELPERVLDWRQLTKLRNTYTEALVEQIDPRTGRVHTSYSQAVASTGRLSSNDPNLQNIPVRTEEGRKIRRAFVAAEGCELLSADYSQIELRLLAHVAGIEELREAFRGGADIHAMTASEVFGVPVEGMEPAVRNRAKAINFGIIYGISPFGLARQLRIPRGDAKDFIDRYFGRFPGIRDYMDETIGFAREHGYVETIFGRKCHTPGIAGERNPRKSFLERLAINAPLQGAAADVIKRAMIRIPPALTASRLSAKMLLQVHDELIFEVPREELDETAAVVSRTMSRAADLDVPLVVDTGHGRTWDEAH